MSRPRLALALAAIAASAVAASAVSCSDHRDSQRVDPAPDDGHTKRVIEPPARTMRPLPPHAIRADGVGPYKLGQPLESVLAGLPSGPRIAQYDIPGVVRRSVVRAEDDAVLIGGEPRGAVSFVAVVGGEVARTESGVHVGSTRAELLRAFGSAAEDADQARDPRLFAPATLPDLRAVMSGAGSGDRVVALVVGSELDAPRRIDHPDGECARPTPTAPGQLGACLGSGEFVTPEGDELIVRAPDGDKPLARAQVPGLQLAAALRAGDHDELVAVARTDDGQQRTWTLTAFRLEGARLVRTIDAAPLYQLTRDNARWIGADLRDLDLYLELGSRPDAIDVGGLLATRAGDKLRDVLVISPISVARHKPRPVAADSDAGVAVEPLDAGSDRRAHP